jgi:hypothetical protein
MTEPKKKWFEISVTNGDTKQKYLNILIGGVPMTFRVSSIIKWTGMLSFLLGTVYKLVVPVVQDFYEDVQVIKNQQKIMLSNDSIQNIAINHLSEYVTKRNIQDKIDSALNANGLSEIIKSDGKIKSKNREYRIPDNALGEYIEQLLRTGNNQQ